MTWSSGWSQKLKILLPISKIWIFNIYVTGNVSVIPVSRGTKLVSRLPSPSTFTSWQWCQTWALPAFFSGFQRPVFWGTPCVLDCWEIGAQGISPFSAQADRVGSFCWWSRCKALPCWRLRWRWVSWRGEHCWDDMLQRLQSSCPHTASKTQSEEEIDWRIKWPCYLRQLLQLLQWSTTDFQLGKSKKSLLRSY